MGDLDPSILYPLKSLGGLFCLCFPNGCLEQMERILVGPGETLSLPPRCVKGRSQCHLVKLKPEGRERPQPRLKSIQG